jgi:sugar-specific transcriptional regulator TrmB
MKGVVKKLQGIGLTEYEAKAYLSLLNAHLSTASKVSEKSIVPRTKIYAVLESLSAKGWVKIYSGVPLLFKAVDPREVFERIKQDYHGFLDSVEATLKKEVKDMKEKFVIKKFDIGLESLKNELEKAKTIEISNATTGFIKKIGGAFRQDAMVRVLMFPDEAKVNIKNVEFRKADVGIVSIVRNKEVPSMSVTLDESRTFSVFQDPVDNHYIIDEMLYDECSRCFAQWSNLSWNAAGQL